jgi:hypothetical protein
MATTMIPDKATFSTKHYHLHSNNTPTVTCFSLQVRPRLSLGSSLKLPLNHFALRSTPALQENTDKARQRAEESRQDEEDGDPLAHIEHARSTMVLTITAIAPIVTVSMRIKTVSDPSPTITINRQTYATDT